LAAGCKSGFVGALHCGASGGADGLAAVGVLVFGCDVADALVEPDCVVERSDAVELALELAGIDDLLEVWVFGLDVAEQALDPGLVVGRAGSSEVGRDPGAGQECLGGLRARS